MRKILFFLLLIPKILFPNGEETASFHGESSAFIWDCVNAITGDFYYRQCDAVFPSAKPFPFHRTYISREVQNKELIWDPTNHLRAQVIIEQSSCKIIIPEPSGINLSYLYVPKREKNAYVLEIPQKLYPGSEHFIQGFVNQSTDLFGNFYDPRKNILNFYGDALKVQLSNGGTRQYVLLNKPKSREKVHNFVLQEETFPDGTKVLYDWSKEHTLQSIAVKNPSKTKTYTSLDAFAKRKGRTNKIVYHPLYGSRLIYYCTGKKVKKAISPEYPLEKIEKNKKAYLEKRIFPNGRELTVLYDKEGRVKTLKGPENTFCKLEYHKNYTKAIDNQKNETRYFYDPYTLRLLRIEYLGNKKTILKIESFVWDDQGHLLEKRIENPFESVLKTIFTYDENSNIQSKSLVGKITHSEAKDETYAHFYTYDPLNRLLEEKEDNGRATKYAYLKETNLPISKTIEKNGIVLQRTFYVYDKDHLLIKEITEDGQEYRIKKITPRNEEPFYGMPESIEEFYREGQEEILLKKTSYIYDDHGNVTTKNIYDSNDDYQYSLITTYTDKDQVQSETDALGHATIYEYDENGNKTQEVTLLGLTIQYHYDACNRLVQKTENGNGHIYITRHQDFDAQNHPQTVIDPLGGKTQNQYDFMGNLISTIDTENARTTYAYNVLGHKILTRDPNHNTTQTITNIYGSPLCIMHPDGTAETFTYNLDGTKASYTNQNNITTFYTYDLFGNVEEENTLDAKITCKFNAFHLLEETNIEGYKTIYTYYPSGFLKQKNYEGQITEYFYDALGRCIKEISDDYILERDYDLGDRIIEEREYSHDKLLTKTQTKYDALGNPTQITTYPNNQPANTTIIYDSFGREIESIDGLGNSTKTHYVYQDKKFIKTVIEPETIQVIETYNTQEKLLCLEKRNSAGQSLFFTSYEYDPCGNNTFEKTAEHTIAYTYDSMHRVETETESDTKTIRYTYSPTGQIHTLTKPDNTILTYTYDDFDYLKTLTSSKKDIHYTYVHDKLGRLLSSTDINGATMSRIYDPHGNMLQETLANGYILKNTYDNRSRRSTFTLPNGHTIRYHYLGPYLHTVDSHKYHYDLAGNIRSEDLIDDTSSSTHYDALSRPIFYNSIHFTQECTYSPRGNILSTKEQQFTYDDLDRLIEEPESTYSYDELDNRLSKNNATYTYNLLNQIESSNIEYDQNGNLIRYNDTHLQYDSLDRLIQVITPLQTTTYTYDSEHRRLSKNNTPCIWDGNHEIGTLNAYRILGPTPNAEIGSAIAIYLDNEPHLPIHDLQGNLIQLHPLNNASIQSQTFTAFGEGEAHFPWGFSSKSHDPETGFIYFGRRYYSPTLGRFITTDPEGYTDSTNLYAFCRNNPLIHNDPYGLLTTNFESWNKFLGREEHWKTEEFLNDNIRQVTLGAMHASFQWALDKTLNFAHSAGGFYGAEDMSFLETYHLGSTANTQLQKSSEKWLQNSFQNTFQINAENSFYQYSYKGSYQGLNIAECFLPWGGSLKASSNLVKSAVKAPKIFQTLQKQRTFKSIFKNLRAESSLQKHLLSEHLKQWEKYGKNGIKYLQGGRIRYYGNVRPAKFSGEIIGARKVREWNPRTGTKRTWNESLDQNYRIRQVRPMDAFSHKTHYMFDEKGNFIKKW